jgi:adenylate cyclase
LIAQAIHQSPHDPLLGNWLFSVGIAKLYLGKDDEAIAWLRRSVAELPNFGASHLFLCAAYAAADRMTEAKAELAEVTRLMPGFGLARVSVEFQHGTNPT